MRKHLRKMGAIVLTAALALSLAACGAETPKVESSQASSKVSSVESKAESKKVSEVSSEKEVKVSGKLTLAGSTSMEKLANAAAEAFMEEYSDVTVTAEFTGSSAGIESLLAGSVDIGNASRALKESEVSAGAVENIVAIDGIAVVVNPQNTTAELTKDDLIKIYKGEITNWSEVGGNDDPIVVVGREAGSGTRGAFEEILDVEDACKYALELDSTGTVVAKVASTSGAIGYVSLDMVDDTVTAVKLDGVEATAQKIKAGEYFLSRPFVMATKGELSEQNEATQAFFEFIYSDTGTKLVESIGLISAK